MKAKLRTLFLIMSGFLLSGCAAELAESGAVELEEGAATAEGLELAPEVASEIESEGIIPEPLAEEVRLSRMYGGDLLSIEKGSNEYTFGEVVDKNTVKIYNYNGLGERTITLPGDIYTVSGDFVRMRNGPGTVYSVLGKFERNQIVLVLRQLGDWYEVRTLDGRIGFIAAALLAPGVSEKHQNYRQVQKPKSLTDQAKDILQLGH